MMSLRSPHGGLQGHIRGGFQISHWAPSPPILPVLHSVPQTHLACSSSERCVSSSSA